MFDKLTLEGDHVRLEPLSHQHREGLIEAVSDGELWKHYVTFVPPVEGVEQFIENSLTAYANGDGLTFATIDKASGNVVGSTRFLRASLAHKRVGIGFTFLAKSYQQTYINTEAKLLMLTHIFEVLQLNRVELITDYLNMPSRNAILRLGAKQEGILRNHMLMPDGRLRDSVIFSITNYDWQGVKQNLAFKLSQA